MGIEEYLAQLEGFDEAVVVTVVSFVIGSVRTAMPWVEWEAWKWNRLAAFLLSVAVPEVVFVLECHSTVDVPVFESTCGAQGAFDAVVVGALAFAARDYAADRVVPWFVETWRETRGRLGWT